MENELLNENLILGGGGERNPISLTIFDIEGKHWCH